MVEAISSVVVAGAAVAAAYFAWRALDTWQQELHGRAQYDAAWRYLQAVYRLRKEIGAVRSPFIMAYEFPDGYDPLATRTPDENADVYAHVYGNRMRGLSEPLVEFDAAAIEAEVVLGPEFKQLSYDMRMCLSKLRATVVAFVDIKRDDLGDGDKDFRIRVRKEINAGDGTDSDDAISTSLRAPVAAIETHIRPYLSK